MSRNQQRFDSVDWDAVEKRRKFYAEQRFIADRIRNMRQLMTDTGGRYEGVSIDKYEIYHQKQEAVIQQITLYEAEIVANVAGGFGIVLIGAVGTGKDHLLISLAKSAIETDARSVRFLAGYALGEELRDSFDSKQTERGIIGKYTSPDVLILSDPLPAVGENKDFMAEAIHRIIDRRNREQRPTWASINAADREEVKTRLGVPTWDRLQQKALIIPCQWPSYRER